ncbi:lysosomal acid lipase/cholesteryl ester hydrolase [Nematostella vectensis]|uniref:lysosomal acid lipase/cholesteryl ester hydrolase n=1 Tax=Nematostella vectensis TaxID=45351 RepID=UPI00207720C2|nr:lysosomal acid lipase/cholesteryl ester hydrolase [Nematostella vectensis]
MIFSFCLLVVLLSNQLCCLLAKGTRPKWGPVDPDVNRNVSQLIHNRGFPVEEHDVITKDGYILSVQRIPHGRKGRESLGPRPVVFLQHGLLADSSCFVQSWEYDSLGYILADNGYDVWLGNIRGNRYSRSHVKYNHKQMEFWDFSFEEFGEYDIPAMIEHALSVSGQSQLYYIGHSQGTLVGFISFSTHPEIAKKVKRFIALAPIFHLNHTATIVRDAAFTLGPIQELLFPLGPTQFFPGYLIKLLTKLGFCGGKYKAKLCYDISELIFGFDDGNANMSRVPVFFTHFPSGTSFKNIIHFGQIVYYGRTARFDYGKRRNMKRYGKPKPPVYDVTKMDVPTALILGTHDNLSTVPDVAPIRAQIPHVTFYEVIPEWNHIDFVAGIDAYKLLYPKLLTLLQEFE